MAAALIGADSQIVGRGLRPTPVEQGMEQVVEEFAALLLDVAALSEGGPPAACGLAVPGLVDAEAGIIRYAANLGGARDFPLRLRLESRLALPIAIDNDLRLHALGESIYGAAVGCRDFLFVGVGTGVGSALFLSGGLYRGARGHAGEIGHILIDPGPQALACTCGRRGCLEAYASGPAMAADFARRAAQSGLALESQSPSLIEIASWLDRDDSRGGLARLVVASGAEVLGRGLSIAANLLDLQRIILGGGVTNLGHSWLAGVQAAFSRRAFVELGPNPQNELVIQLSSLGGDAALLGAAALASRHFHATSVNG